MEPRRKRHLRLPLCLLIPLLLGSGGAGCGGPGDPPARVRPNIVFIVMDTARADHCSVHGYGRPTTPNLESLAREGVRFDQAWSPSRWTGPSHASMFTGYRPKNHGYWADNRTYLDARATTLAEILKGAGYRTGCISANNMVSPDFGLTQGFDYFEPLYAAGPRTYSRATWAHELGARWALAPQASRQPFFLFINDLEPHMPYTPPRPFDRQFLPEDVSEPLLAKARAFDIPLHFLYGLGLLDVGTDQIALMRDLYDGEIAAVDSVVGTLLDRLRSAGVLDNTLVIVTSDHGECLGEHRLLGHSLGMHSCLLHVPLVVRFPGVFEGGKTVRDVVRLEDLMPTCLDVCGVEIPAGLDGRSLTSDLPGRLALGLVGHPLTIEVMRQDFSAEALAPYDCITRSVFDGRYLYMSSSNGRERLHDLSSDPGESENLAGKLADVAARLRALLPE